MVYIVVLVRFFLLWFQLWFLLWLCLGVVLFLVVVLFLGVVLFPGVVLRPAERGDDDWPGASSPNTAERRPSSHSSIPSSSLSLQHVERLIFLLIVISEF